MTTFINMVNQYKFSCSLNCVVYFFRSSFYRHGTQSFERLDYTHKAAVRAPAYFPPIIWRYLRVISYTIIETHKLGNPADSFLQSRVVEITKVYQAPHHIPGQAGDYFCFPTTACLFCCILRKSSLLPFLRIFYYVLTLLFNMRRYLSA